MDKSFEHQYVIMYKDDAKYYPRFLLPEGFCFTPYVADSGYEKEWAKLQHQQNAVKSVHDGINIFKGAFIENQTIKPEKRVWFVKDENGIVAASASLWNGMFLGKEEQRIHYLVVSKHYEGKGIAKALLTKIHDIYNEMNNSNFLYLVTQTWSYPAINVYYKFGYKEYWGDNPLTNYNITNDEFIEKNKRGWELIHKKLNML